MSSEKVKPDAKYAGELLLGLTMTAFSMFVIVEAVGMPQRGPGGLLMGPGFVPLLAGVVLLLLCSWLTLSAILKGGYRQLGQCLRDGVADVENKRFLIILAIMAIYVLGLLGRIPFIAATVIYYVLIFVYIKAGSLAKITLYTLLATFLFAFFLPRLFEMPLP
ncbi:MAG: tripartite tricarboxylate transporter TctB family protein [Fidelibacterota bacterium]|nr:MAG: tripartite tricarboxylate transporter TctB family protein [Candidatus Neomarinimicrobiota bacterium]